MTSIDMNKKQTVICKKCKSLHAHVNYSKKKNHKHYCPNCHKKGTIISLKEHERYEMKKKIAVRLKNHMKNACKIDLKKDTENLHFLFDYFALVGSLIIMVAVILYFYTLG